MEETEWNGIDEPEHPKQLYKKKTIYKHRKPLYMPTDVCLECGCRNPELQEPSK